MYNIKTGKEHQLKISKQNFFDDEKNPVLQIGDLIKVNSMEQKPKQKLVEGKWVKTDVMQLWLNRWELINRVNN